MEQPRVSWITSPPPLPRGLPYYPKPWGCGAASTWVSAQQVCWEPAGSRQASGSPSFSPGLKFRAGGGSISPTQDLRLGGPGSWASTSGLEPNKAPLSCLGHTGATEFLFGVMKIFWNKIVVLVTQPCEYITKPTELYPLKWWILRYVNYISKTKKVYYSRTIIFKSEKHPTG